MVYQIRIKGHLGPQWTDWFEGLTITLEEDGDTLLTGPVVDQAALHGLLKKVRDLGLPLVSVSPVEPGQAGCVRCQIMNRRRRLVYAKSITTRRGRNEHDQQDRISNGQRYHPSCQVHGSRTSTVERFRRMVS